MTTAPTTAEPPAPRTATPTRTAPATPTTPTASTADPVAATSAAVAARTALQAWLVEHRNRGVTPDRIAAELVANGWDADAAARVSLQSLRSGDRGTLTYSALTVASGLAGLGAAGAAHLILAGNPDPLELTWMLSIAVVAAPIALTTALLARRLERRSRFVLWSPSRRGWFGALALCTGVVGVGRLLTYVFSAIATLTGASDRPFTAVAAAQVLVSLAVALPLFAWSFVEWRRSNLVLRALERHDRPAAPQR